MGTSETSQQTPTPLDSCILIDYRLSSKAKLKDHITATKLFEFVHEPTSLTVGIEMVASDKVETCIFGPSVRPEKIQEFIESSQVFGTSRKCAFMVLQPRNRSGDIPGVHAIVEFPCSQPHFNVGIVRALVGANGGTLPAPRRTDPQTKKPISLKERLSKLEFPGVPRKAEEPTSVQNKAWPKSLVEAVSKYIPDFYDKLLDVHPFHLKFRVDGTPTDFTINAVKNVIAESFPTTDQVPDIVRFREMLEQVLYRWVKRATEQGRAAADFILRREIRDCLRVD